MSYLPLFESGKTIQAEFSPDADIVLYQGDTEDFIESLPAESVKLIVTSPPYNLGKAYETKVSVEKYLADQARTIAKL